MNEEKTPAQNAAEMTNDANKQFKLAFYGADRISDKSPIAKVRDEMGLKAFELADWLQASECGGLKAEPHIKDHSSIAFEDHSLVKIDYTYSSHCGYTDSLYTTGFDGKTVYSDLLKVDNDGIVTDVAGYNSPDGNILQHDWWPEDYAKEKIDAFYDEFRPKLEEALALSNSGLYHDYAKDLADKSADGHDAVDITD